MTEEKKRQSLEYLDTSEVLTKEELIELKKLAKMSIIGKWIIGRIIAFVSITGMDKISDWFKH